MGTFESVMGYSSLRCSLLLLILLAVLGAVAETVARSQTLRPLIFSAPLRIPMDVHQMWYDAPTLTPEICRILGENKQRSPGWTFHFYDHVALWHFFKDKPEWRKTFASINPALGAARSDFARYCILYTYGGVYMDIKVELKHSLSSAVGRRWEGCIDGAKNDTEPWRYKHPSNEQWFLAFAPGHPYMKRVIAQIGEDVALSRTFGCVSHPHNAYVATCSKQKILHFTGPDALSRAIRSSIPDRVKYISLSDHMNYSGVSEAHKLHMYSRANLRHYAEQEDVRIFAELCWTADTRYADYVTSASGGFAIPKVIFQLQEFPCNANFGSIYDFMAYTEYMHASFAEWQVRDAFVEMGARYDEGHRIAAISWLFGGIYVPLNATIEAGFTGASRAWKDKITWYVALKDDQVVYLATPPKNDILRTSVVKGMSVGAAIVKHFQLAQLSDGMHESARHRCFVLAVQPTGKEHTVRHAQRSVLTLHREPPRAKPAVLSPNDDGSRVLAREETDAL